MTWQRIVLAVASAAILFLGVAASRPSEPVRRIAGTVTATPIGSGCGTASPVPGGIR